MKNNKTFKLQLDSNWFNSGDALNSLGNEDVVVIRRLKSLKNILLRRISKIEYKVILVRDINWKWRIIINLNRILFKFFRIWKMKL